MNKKHILFGLLFWLMCTSAALAATYNIGPGQTYETLAEFHAAVTPQPGDIIDGGGNTFNEELDPPASGTEGAVITYQNFTVFPSTELTGAWSGPDSYGIYTRSLSTTPGIITVDVGGTIKQLFLIHDSESDSSRTTYLRTSATYMVSGFESVSYRTSIEWWDMLERILGYDDDTNTLYYSERNDDDPNDDSIYWTSKDSIGVDFSGRSWVVVDGVTVQGAFTGVKFATGSHNNTFQNGNIYHGRYGVSSTGTGTNNTVDNCTISMRYYAADVTGQPLGAGTDDDIPKSRVEHIYQYGKHVMGLSTSYNTGVYIDASGYSNNITISNCDVGHNFTGMSIENSTLTISGNTVNNCSSVGLSIRDSIAGDIEYNTVYDNRRNSRLHDNSPSDTRNINLHHNKFWNPIGVGYHFYVHFADSGDAGGIMRIYNNSFSGAYVTFGFGGSSFVPNYYVYNNIISSGRAWGHGDSTFEDVAQGTAWNWWYNWVGGGSVNTAVWNTATYGNIDAEGTYMWTLSDTIEPDWTDVSNDVVDAGFDFEDETNPWYDDSWTGSIPEYNGTAPDIGAYETGTTAVTPELSGNPLISSTGNSITLNFNTPITFGGGGNGGFVITPSGGAATLIYSSGDGTSALVYSISRTIHAGETATLDYTQPGNGIESVADGTDLVTFSSQAVSNQSESGVPSVSSASVSESGDSVTIVFDKAVYVGTGGGDDFKLHSEPGVNLSSIPIVQEAEDMTLTSPMESVADANAGGGYAIHVPSGTVVDNPTTAEAFYTVSVPSTDSYFLWVRMYGETYDSDRMYVGIDSVWDRVYPSSLGSYQWVQVETEHGSEAYAWSLTEGNHSINISHGEIGAKIDKFFLTNDGNAVPDEVALAYSSGSGTTELTFTTARTIQSTETSIELSYTQPGDGIEDVNGADLVSFTGQSVTNSSTGEFTCADGPSYCTTENDCATYWSDYYWCTDTCQQTACDTAFIDVPIGLGVSTMQIGSGASTMTIRE